MTLIFFFFNDTATTEIYTLSLHDALPISQAEKAQERLEDDRGRHQIGGLDDDRPEGVRQDVARQDHHVGGADRAGDRKSTRLNSSHLVISYAVFCLQKKNTEHTYRQPQHT